MNPTRSSAYQINECLRLASFLGPDGRLYSNEEIAEKLGETVEWVASLLSERGAWQSPRRLANIESCPVNMTYDPGPASRPQSSEIPDDHDD
jgi:hypothetical protein